MCLFFVLMFALSLIQIMPSWSKRDTGDQNKTDLKAFSYSEVDRGYSQHPCASLPLSTADPPEKVESEAASDELPDCQQLQITNVQEENGSESFTDDNPKSFIRY